MRAEHKIDEAQHALDKAKKKQAQSPRNPPRDRRRSPPRARAGAASRDRRRGADLDLEGGRVPALEAEP
jgi:hypothetical protein